MKKIFLTLLKRTFDAWKKHNPIFMAAAISFYILLSLGPILVLMLFLFNIVFGQGGTEGRISSNIKNIAGPQPAEFIKSIMSQASTSTGRTLTLIASIPLMFFGSTMVFFQLKYALNLIFEHTKKEKRGIGETVRKYSISILMLIVIGVIFFLLMIKNPVLVLLKDNLSEIIRIPWSLFRILDAVFSFALLVLLFEMVYVILPDKKMKFRDSITGALVTSVLFTAVQFLVLMNVKNTQINSAYGAIGYFTVLLLWIFYSSLVFLFGASFTKAISETKLRGNGTG